MARTGTAPACEVTCSQHAWVSWGSKHRLACLALGSARTLQTLRRRRAHWLSRTRRRKAFCCQTIRGCYLLSLSKSRGSGSALFAPLPDRNIPPLSQGGQVHCGMANTRPFQRHVVCFEVLEKMVKITARGMRVKKEEVVGGVADWEAPKRSVSYPKRREYSGYQEIWVPDVPKREAPVFQFLNALFNNVQYNLSVSCAMMAAISLQQCRPSWRDPNLRLRGSEVGHGGTWWDWQDEPLEAEKVPEPEVSCEATGTARSWISWSLEEPRKIF